MRNSIRLLPSRCYDCEGRQNPRAKSVFIIERGDVRQITHNTSALQPGPQSPRRLVGDQAQIYRIGFLSPNDYHRSTPSTGFSRVRMDSSTQECMTSAPPRFDRTEHGPVQGLSRGQISNRFVDLSLVNQSQEYYS